MPQPEQKLRLLGARDRARTSGNTRLELPREDRSEWRGEEFTKTLWRRNFGHRQRAIAMARPPCSAEGESCSECGLSLRSCAHLDKCRRLSCAQQLRR